jgi:RimJ/RimL family protein N-acetyltransferase
MIAAWLSRSSARVCPSRLRRRIAEMAISLRTPRLLLREWRDTDCEPFAAISADPEVMAMLPLLPDRAASDAWIAEREPIGPSMASVYGRSNSQVRPS